MLRTSITLVGISICVTFGALQSAIAQTGLPIEDQHHYLGARLLNANGLELNYSYRLEDQMLMGVSFANQNQTVGDSRDGSGDLLTGQYYAHDAKVTMLSEEINFTYLFNEEGYKEFGFLLRAGVGQAHGKAVGKFYRFDKDPGLFQFGDGKRLLETGPNNETSFSTMYARLGLHYQCVFKRKTESVIGAHIFEFGASGWSFQNKPRLAIQQSNGVTKMLDIELPPMTFEAAYTMVF